MILVPPCACRWLIVILLFPFLLFQNTSTSSSVIWVRKLKRTRSARLLQFSAKSRKLWLNCHQLIVRSILPFARYWPLITVSGPSIRWSVHPSFLAVAGRGSVDLIDVRTGTLEPIANSPVTLLSWPAWNVRGSLQGWTGAWGAGARARAEFGGGCPGIGRDAINAAPSIPVDLTKRKRSTRTTRQFWNKLTVNKNWIWSERPAGVGCGGRLLENRNVTGRYNSLGACCSLHLSGPSSDGREISDQTMAVESNSPLTRMVTCQSHDAMSAEFFTRWRRPVRLNWFDRSEEKRSKPQVSFDARITPTAKRHKSGTGYDSNVRWRFPGCVLRVISNFDRSSACAVSHHLSALQPDEGRDTEESNRNQMKGTRCLSFSTDDGGTRLKAKVQQGTWML